MARKPSAAPDAGGGNSGKTAYTRGRKPDARTSGQDLMRGEHQVGEPPKLQPGLTWAGARNPETMGDGTRDILAAGRVSTIPAGLAYGEMQMSDGAERTITGTSIFDPVLCELAYRWFCPPAGVILDPFAGGSVRGIVASRLGRKYVGVDLSARQVAANEEQAQRIAGDPPPAWLSGDSRDIGQLAQGLEADFVFSCPPYYDLEVYSDDPRDLSRASWAEFQVAYRAIVAGACALLKPDRFACFVVGDIRDQRGFYRGFPPLTVAAFEAAGVRLYNEAILITAAGSLPIRAGRQFEVSRKLGKTHQNVLVFCKGDPRKATQAVGPVEFGEVEGVDEAPAGNGKVDEHAVAA